MRILVIGATGTIGRAVVAALAATNEIVSAARHGTPVRIDIGDRASIRSMYKQVGQIDAVVCAAGSAKFGELHKLSDDDFEFSLRNKLMGQVNLVRYGIAHMRDGGSFTLTSGVLGQNPIVGSSAISVVNAGVDAFARAAALEAPRGIRVNVVSPPWVDETLKALGMDPSGGMPAATVAQAYVKSVTGTASGTVISP